MSALALLQTHLPPLACGGHLLIDLPIFMGPVFLLVGWLLVMTRRTRKQESESVRLPEGRLSL